MFAFSLWKFETDEFIIVREILLQEISEQLEILYDKRFGDTCTEGVLLENSAFSRLSNLHLKYNQQFQRQINEYDLDSIIAEY
jgi:hypothetical protein